MSWTAAGLNADAAAYQWYVARGARGAATGPVTGRQRTSGLTPLSSGAKALRRRAVARFSRRPQSLLPEVGAPILLGAKTAFDKKEGRAASEFERVMLCSMKRRAMRVWPTFAPCLSFRSGRDASAPLIPMPEFRSRLQRPGDGRPAAPALRFSQHSNVTAPLRFEAFPRVASRLLRAEHAFSGVSRGIAVVGKCCRVDGHDVHTSRYDGPL